MDLRVAYLKLSLKGFPTTFSDVVWEESPLLSFARFQRFIRELLPKNVVFAYNDNGEIINRVLTDELYGPEQIKALDFAQYFRDSFGDARGAIPTAPLLYVFNVGDEEVRDYTFSDKKLFNIIQTNIQRGNCVIVVSNSLTPTTFKRNYPTSAGKIEITQQILK